MRALGLMSGTSLDGIDIGVVDTDGIALHGVGPFATFAYSQHQQDYLRGLIQGKEDWEFGEIAVAQWHISAIKDFFKLHPDVHKGLDVIGFHGQTVYHNPQGRITRALGNAAQLAVTFGIDVVADFRSHDLAQGGWGAPLVPIFHQALAQKHKHPLLFLNLGGIANVTYVDGDELIAFDIGPCNALLNDWISQKTQDECDINGKYSSQGMVHASVVKQFMNHTYFMLQPPKALDRNTFDLSLCEGLSCEDGAATLVALTAACLRHALEQIPRAPEAIILCGGGRKNPVLVGALRDVYSHTVSIDSYMGMDGDAVEAYAFGYLAVRSWRGLPLSFPHTTGCSKPVTGGALYQATKVAS